MRDTALVWRLESDEGCGAYGCAEGAALHDLTTTYNDCYTEDSRHPAPRIDPILSEWWCDPENYETRRNYYFGFPSTEAYLRWVFCPDTRAELANDGCRLRLYAVPVDAYQHGLRQCVFRRDRARVLLDVRPDSVDDPDHMETLRATLAKFKKEEEN